MGWPRWGWWRRGLYRQVAPAPQMAVARVADPVRRFLECASGRRSGGRSDRDISSPIRGLSRGGPMPAGVQYVPPCPAHARAAALDELFSPCSGLCALLAQGSGVYRASDRPLSLARTHLDRRATTQFVGTFVCISPAAMSRPRGSRIVSIPAASTERLGSSMAVRAKSSAVARRCVAYCPTSAR